MKTSFFVGLATVALSGFSHAVRLNQDWASAFVTMSNDTLTLAQDNSPTSAAIPVSNNLAQVNADINNDWIGNFVALSYETLTLAQQGAAAGAQPAKQAEKPVDETPVKAPSAKDLAELQNDCASLKAAADVC